MSFDKIPVDASTKMPDDLMDSIEPFDYKEMRPFMMEYMPGFFASKYDVTRKRAADARMTAQDSPSGRRSGDSVKNYNNVTVHAARPKGSILKRLNTACSRCGFSGSIFRKKLISLQ